MRSHFSSIKQPKLKDFNLLKKWSRTQKCLRYNENENNAFCKKFKKAKYKEYLDLESYSNNNIFIDNNISINNSNIVINDSQINPTKNDHLFKSGEIFNKKFLIENENKNSLKFENHNKYPLIAYKNEINKRNIKNPYDYYINDKYDYSIYHSIKSTNSNRDIDMNKDPQNIYFLKNHIKNCFLKYNEFLDADNNSNVFSEKNINIDFNNYNKYETFRKNANLCNSEKEYHVNKIVFKLMDGYLNKILQLFIEHMKTFLKKNIVQVFYKAIKEYIEIKEKNTSKNRKRKFTDKEIFDKNIHISFTIYNSHEINKAKDFNKCSNISNIIFKKKFISHNDNNQEKYNFDNVNISINKNENKMKYNLQKKSTYTSYLKMHINRNSNNINHDINLEKRKKEYNYSFQNDSSNKDYLSRKIITKKTPKSKFLHTKKQSYDLQTYKLKSKYLISNLEKTITKKEYTKSKHVTIKPHKMFNYKSSDNKIYITTKYYIYMPYKNNLKSIESKINYFDNNLLKTTNNDSFYYLFGIKENNIIKDYFTSETNCENLENFLNNKNTDNFNNSKKINKGILLLQNLINKNYEEEFYNSNKNVEPRIVNNFNKGEKKGKNNLSNNENKEQTKSKNKINSKLIKIISSIDNKNNQNLLKNYFNNFHSILNNKSRKQLLVKKTEILRKVHKTISSTAIKNDQIFLENKSIETHNNSKSKNSSELKSSLNFDKIENVENFSGNNENTDINSIKLGNELSDYSFISVPLVPKFYSSSNVNGLIKNKDESFYENYHKSQDFIFSFRLLLILYYLGKKNPDQD